MRRKANSGQVNKPMVVVSVLMFLLSTVVSPPTRSSLFRDFDETLPAYRYRSSESVGGFYC